MAVGRMPAVFKILTKADGVTIEKIDDLSYRVSLGAKTVVFDLNDLGTSSRRRMR